MTLCRLVGNFARSPSNAVFRSASQLPYWATVLLYRSLGMSDGEILMPLYPGSGVGQSESVPELLLGVSRSLAGLLVVLRLTVSVSDLSFYLSKSRNILRCFIN